MRIYQFPGAFGRRGIGREYRRKRIFGVYLPKIPDVSVSTDTYQTLSQPAEGEFKDRGSKFLAYAFPVTDEEQIKERIAEVKALHPKARHHCYAYQLGPGDDRYRANDDGEPSGSAGLPILNTIRSFNVTDTLVIVVRYFGGTLLGVSGLINAYKSAAYEALSQADIVEKTVNRDWHIRFDYPQMNAIMQFIKTHDIAIREQTFDTKSGLIISVRLSLIPVLQETFGDIAGIEMAELPD